VLVGQPAEFTGANSLKIGERTLTARHVIICTGAKAIIPPIEGLAGETNPGGVAYLTHENIFELDELPPRMAVVGGGPIGCELAQAFARLGTQVTIFASQLLPREDPVARDVIELAFQKDGIRHVKARATKVRQNVDGEIIISAGEHEATCDQVLISAGRAPNVSGMQLESAGVVYSKKGIEVDNKLKTSCRSVYAAGDCVGGPQFTHYAGYQSTVAALNILYPAGKNGTPRFNPAVTFTDPEVAQVGLTEPEARKRHGGELRVLLRTLDTVDRAICEGETDGFIKIICNKKGLILGATMVAPTAGEMIAEIALAMNHGLSMQKVASSVHAYPAMGFVLMQMGAEVMYEDLEDASVTNCLTNCMKPRRLGRIPAE